MLSEAERELLLVCARQHLAATDRKRVREIATDSLSWNELIEAARRHGIAGLLFHNLQSSNAIESVRPDILHVLRQGYVRSAFRNQAHYIAIGEILERAAGAKLDVVLLKGAALARTVYDDQALRPFADIDLLVRESELSRAKHILSELGYGIAPGLLSETFNRKYHSNLPFVRNAPHPVHIELHWRLNDRFSRVVFDYNSIFDRTRPLAIDGTNGLMLGPEDQFLYLALHLDNHGYLNRALVQPAQISRFVFHPLSGDRLIWFTDLHELVCARVDWDQLLNLARVTDASEELATTLRLLHVLLATPIPESLLRQLPISSVPWPERKIGRYVFSLADTEPETSPKVIRFQNRFLVTRKDFELRLIRLMDLWRYIFPVEKSVKFYPAHVAAALARCGKMFAELLCLRAIRYARARF